MTTVADATFDKHHYHSQVSRLWTPTLRRFNRLVRASLLFNCFFLLLATIEIGLFLSFFALLSQSTVLAFTLAIFFLTIFSYFVLRLYIQAKRPEQLVDLCEEYLHRCKEIIRYQEGIPEHHIALATAAHKFAATLHEKEYTFFSPPFFLKPLAPSLEKFSCFYFWKDLHRLKELLLTTSVEEHLKVVQCEPTNLEVHAALANAYVMLSSLYADPRKYHDFDEERWIPPERYSMAMQETFRATAQRAIEEFEILNDYAPDDPWVHVQLAYSYHDLQMPEEEIQEYEIVLKLRPNDKDTLFKLGMLYFQQGMNAKGLRIYEMLKHTHYKKAESLIKFYGSYET
ncbi:MAG: hypothetical protein S4CHLAM2_03380 [Chlamydiales bacterium]|nr:hypothetical protein [Chlamydiales bacterium]